MHVTFAAVISIDGRITRGDEPDVHAWTSDEDWQHFVQLRDTHDALVTDRKSYEAVRPQPTPGLLRIVLTTHPEAYAAQAVPGQLEFMTSTALGVVQVLQARGCQRLLVAGGSNVSYDFFAAKLINEVYMTIEPYLFGVGKPLLAALPLDVSLRLQEVTTLNQRGTLLAHYRVVR